MFEFHRFNDPSHSNNLEAISFPGDGNSATMQQRKSTFDCIRLDFQSKSSPYCTGRVEMTFSKKLAVLEATDQLQLLLPESNNQRGRSFKRANQPIHWKINYFPLRYPRAGTVPPNYFSCFHGKFLFSIDVCRFESQTQPNDGNLLKMSTEMIGIAGWIETILAPFQAWWKCKEFVKDDRAINCI